MPLGKKVSIIAEEKIKLAAVRQRHAKEAARHLRTIHEAAAAMAEIEAKVDEEARAIAGNDWRSYHEVGFQASTDDILQQVNDMGEIIAFPFQEVAQHFKELATQVEAEAQSDEPMQAPFKRQRSGL